MTVRELRAEGYKEVFKKTEKGYKSRKCFNPDNQVIRVAGGFRKGMYYYLAPNWDSSRYCYRVYMAKEA